jgi:hypothetical protein
MSRPFTRRGVTVPPRADVPPALAKYQEQEVAWKAEATQWVRETLREFFESEAGYEPRTAAEVMDVLDREPSMPFGYARLVRSETPAYNERYATVRNALEGMARKRELVLGTAINAKGNPRATTYARPRDATKDWVIAVEASTHAAGAHARQAVKEWLQLEGSALEGVTSLTLRRKRGGSIHEVSPEEEVAGER